MDRMNPDITEVERAFQLARTGICCSVSDIRKRLLAEGYSGSQLSGPYLAKQLRAIMREKIGRGGPLHQNA
jgi:hypothetical protein